MIRVKFSINGETNADQVTDKVKKSVSNLEKNIEGIQNKFKTFGKDLFLSFLGPMVLFNSAVNLISNMIAENQRRQKEATQAAIDGTNELMSAEDRYYQRKRDNEMKDRERVSQAALTREDVTANFLKTDPRGRQIVQENRIGQFDPRRGVIPDHIILSMRKEIQDKVQAIIAEDMKRQGISPAEMGMRKSESSFKPEGLSSNIIGVGQSPYMAAMNEQTRLQAEILRKLEEFDAREREKIISQPSGTTFKLKPEYSVPAYPQFK